MNIHTAAAMLIATMTIGKIIFDGIGFIVLFICTYGYTDKGQTSVVDIRRGHPSWTSVVDVRRGRSSWTFVVDVRRGRSS